MKNEKIGLLVMAYGTPYKESDIEPYYTHIRHGRKPSREALQDLAERYQAIGGISPLAKITENQAHALQDKVNELQSDYEFQLYIGLKHITPFIEDTVKQMADDGVKRAVSIVLAPHYSTFSVKSYNGRAKEEADKYGIDLASVVDWYDEPGFIQYWAEEIKQTYDNMTETERDKAVLIVSAHILPEKILADRDTYTTHLATTASIITEKTAYK